MFCKYCGTNNADNAAICTGCGKSLTEIAPPTFAAPPKPMTPPAPAGSQPAYPGAPANNQPVFGGMPANNQPAFNGMPANNQPAFGGMPANNRPAFNGMPANNQPAFNGMPANNQPAFGGMPANNQPAFNGMPTGNQPAFNGMPAGNQPYPGMPMGGNPYAMPAAKTRGPRKINIIALIAAVIVGISTFLPLASASAFGYKQSINLFQGGDAIFFIIVAVLALIFAIPGLDIGVTIMGAISLIMFFIENSGFKSAMSFVKRDIGFYTLLIGSLLMLAGGIVGIIQRQKRK